MNWCKKFLVVGGLSVIMSVWAVAQSTNILPNGGFESGKPSLWNAEPGTGATLTWATDQAKSLPRSLKIVKTGTGSTARWISENNVRYWLEKIDAGTDIRVGAWVKTSGVNTNPANADAKWQLKFWFYDALGALIGGAPFALDVDQSTATRDWYADTNGVASLILPKEAYRYVIAAEAGPTATGTVWFDNFIHVGRSDPSGKWSGQNWNGFVDADSGWQYWIHPSGGNDGQTSFPGSGVTTEAARTGSYSLKVTAPGTKPSGELVWISETVPIPVNSKGKKYVLSAWVKTTDIKKDSVFNSSYAIGFTWTWHSKMFTDGGGWNEVRGEDYRFVLNQSGQDWTQYSVTITVPENNVQAISVRARTFPLWTGVSYYDDFSVNALNPAVATSVEKEPTPIAGGVPLDFALLQNYPNPFNPSTIIEYHLPVRSAVTLQVFNIVGQKVATLVEQEQNAGRWSVKWDARNDAGAKVSSGIYFYRLSTSTLVLSGKMLLLK